MEKRIGERCITGNKYKTKLFVLHAGKITNISIDGICLETSQSIDPNDICRIEIISSNNEKITLQCVVEWSTLRQVVKEKDETFSIYGVGLKFIELTTSEKLFIEKYISEFAK